MSETTSTPEPSSTPDPTRQHSAVVPGEPVAAPVTPKRARRRTALIAGSGVLAALVLAGSGIAVGAAIADDFADDDQDDTAQTAGDEEDTSDASTTTSASYGAESAADVLAVIDAASGTAEGDVVSVDADQDGTWEVEFRRESGDETEVHVDSNGQASIVSAEPAEDSEGVPNGALDRDTVEALVGAALDQADGQITEIEVDDDQVAPYEVSVLTDDRRTVTLGLDADFAVVSARDED